MTIRMGRCLFSLAALVHAAPSGPPAPLAVQGEPDLVFIDGFDLPSPAAISAQIAAARAAPDGPAALPVEGAPVTYVTPAIGLDPPGFFVQAEPNGPALFVAVDSATLLPPPVPGDRAAFTITALTTAGGRRQATAIAGYERRGGGFPVGALAQPVSDASDLVSAVSSYESEMVRLVGTVVGPFVDAGLHFQSAPMDTAAVAGDPALALRLPTAVADTRDIATQCTFDLGPTPLWRNGSTAQPSAWTVGDLALVACAAPRLLEAWATMATQVLLVFDRRLDPGSVQADGGQFVFSGGPGALVATAAAAIDRTVTVTTTTQTAAAGYTVTVAGTVRDTLGAGVDAAFDSAAFAGFRPLASLRLNEVNANLPGGADLAELLVVSSGITQGVAFVQNPGTLAATTLATLPAISVASGDLIVVHLVPPPGVVSETSSPSECTHAACYAGAWDVAGGATGMTYTNQVLAVRAPGTRTIQDAVAYVRPPNAPVGFLGALQHVQGQGQWLPASCGGAPCTYTSVPSATSISFDWTGLGATVAGTSAQRRAGGLDTHGASDWRTGASTFGLVNP
jgi:hypothetical protein